MAAEPRRFFCLEGPMVVETRAPRTLNELKTGESCSVAPKTAHHVHGKGGAERISPVEEAPA